MTTSGDNATNANRPTMAAWMIPPAQGWHRKSSRLFWQPLAKPLFAIGLILLLIFAVDFLWVQPADKPPSWWLTHLASLFLVPAIVVSMLLGIHRRLHLPLAHLRGWALRIRRGDLSVRIPVPARGEFTELAADINELSNALQLLAEDMDRQVRNQTTRLAQKNQSLEILYDVAASLNAAHDLDDLLTRFLQTLMKVVNARAATVRLLTNDGHMRLVASAGVDETSIEWDRFMRADHCLCGMALSTGELFHQKDLHCCSRAINHPSANGQALEMIVVPLQYRDQILGAYNLFTATPGLAGREDMRDLLVSIGRHLGMAVEKTRLDTESHRLSLMQERNMLAHELHDSLAQSLASLCLQVQMLDESLRQNDHSSARDDIGKIKIGMDSAYRQLRELLVHCRAPMDERGLLPAIEELVECFRRDTGIAVFLQKDCHEMALPPELEVQVLHIVQEALTNIRKHSRAKNVRLFLRCDHDGNHQVLVEDDGSGIVAREGASLPGEHLGLRIMHERARCLGGTLSVDSEPGDGTRLSLRFAFNPRRLPLQGQAQ